MNERVLVGVKCIILPESVTAAGVARLQKALPNCKITTLTRFFDR